MIIETKKIAELKPAPYNPRQSTAKQEAQLKASLSKFGLVEPIIYNKQTGFIVGGHFRIRELKKLGYEEVECVIVDLNEADEKELNIRLNANTGQWDWELLANEWNSEELSEWGLEVPIFGSDVDYSEKNKEIDTDEFDDKMIIKLEFTESDYHLVKDKLSKIASTPEQAIFTLLGLNNE
jgi:ParB-like chromosome segregation protein Spo0J